MRKRERENPCAICGHYHKYEEGEVCVTCGHRLPETSEKSGVEIAPEFLYMDSYDRKTERENPNPCALCGHYHNYEEGEVCEICGHRLPETSEKSGLEILPEFLYSGSYDRKRERESPNPCALCGHYHKYEEGEVCRTCGHRLPETSEKSGLDVSAFPSEILPEFLYLGSYDNASRSELLKTQGIFRILNTVPSCKYLYKDSFTYHCLKDEKTLQFGDAIGFLEKCRTDKARVLVHCMSGKNRSAAIVIAYLMKCKGWRLTQSYRWLKERRPIVGITRSVYQQLQEYERSLFGSTNNINPSLRLTYPSVDTPSTSLGFAKNDDPARLLVFGFGKMNDPVQLRALSNAPTTSTFGRTPLDTSPHGLTFGGSQTESSVGDIQMDSS